MSEALVPASVEPVVTDRGADVVLPALIVDAGPDAVQRFLEFFAGRIANPRTRAAYGRAVGQFLGWCEARGLRLRDVSPLHVAAYVRTHPGSVPTVKQHLAAIRMLGDWLVVNQVLPVNPAAAVRGPKHVVTKGATPPVLSPAEARKLLETIDTDTLAGLRDRALLSVMLYSFARGERGVWGCGDRTTSGRGAGGGSGSMRRAGGGTTSRPTTGRRRRSTSTSRRPGSMSRRWRCSRAWTRRAPVDGPGVAAAGSPGDDQAARRGRGTPTFHVLPHVSGDGDHSVLVERGNPRARAADRGARLTPRRRSSTTGRRTR